MKEVWEMNNTELRIASDNEGYTNGMSNRLMRERKIIEDKYGKRYHDIHPSEITLEEYMRCEITPKTPYSFGYPAIVAISDHEACCEGA